MVTGSPDTVSAETSRPLLANRFLLPSIWINLPSTRTCNLGTSHVPWYQIDWLVLPTPSLVHRRKSTGPLLWVIYPMLIVFKADEAACLNHSSLFKVKLEFRPLPLPTRERHNAHIFGKKHARYIAKWEE